MRKLLITGGNGLLGSALRSLCPQGIFVSSENADLRHLDQVWSIFKKHKPSHVLHLAAKVGGVSANAQHSADLLSDNLQINTNVLSVASDTKVSRLVSILSSCAFKLYSERVSREEDLHSGNPFKGNLGYGYSKRILDIHTKLLYEQYGCQFSTVAPVTMYGPHDNFDMDEGHVVSSLIHKTLVAKEMEKPLVVWGSGQAIRQFVYVDDIAKLLIEMLESFDGPETIIVAQDEGHTIRFLAEAIAESIGFDGEIQFDRSQEEGVLVKRIKSSRFIQRFPDFQFTPLHDGLRKTIEWFKKVRLQEALSLNS